MKNYIVIILLIIITGCQDDPKIKEEKEQPDAGIHKVYERGPLVLEIDVDQAELNLAQRLNLTLTAEADADYKIELPKFGEKLEQFGIVDYHTKGPELIQNNKTRISRTYLLEPFLSGDYSIPSMQVKFSKPEEDKVHQIETEELKIKVNSLLPEEMKEMKVHDIKPPVKLPVSYTTWLWAAAIFAMHLIGLALWIIIKKLRQGPRSQVKTPAHEIAFQELEILVQQNLIDNNEIKLFYQGISAILRRYIERRFTLKASEQTSEEFLAGMSGDHRFPEKYKGLLNHFLKHCDLVKFAEHQPGEEDIQKTFDSCKEFISGTIPVAEEG